MIKLQVLTPDTSKKAPRSGPTVETEIDPENIAFMKLVLWSATEATGQRFTPYSVGDPIAGDSVFLLMILLVDAVDSAKVCLRFSPVNVLFVPDYQESLTQIRIALGKTLFATTINREILIPVSYNSIGLVLDGKRVKMGKGNADGWINTRTVTSVLGVDTTQGLAFKNYHPLPVPTLEYRVFVPPSNELIKLIEGDTGLDYANTLPPDDGSGDWLYRSIVQALDVSRHAKTEGIRTLGNVTPAAIVTFIRTIPFSGFTVATGYDIYDRGLVTASWAANYLSFTPLTDDNNNRDEENKNATAMNGVWPSSFIGMMNEYVYSFAHKGAADRFVDVKRFADALPLLPCLVANGYYNAGWINRRLVKHDLTDWWSYTTAPAQLSRLSPFFPPVPVAESELLKVFFHLLGNREGQNTYIVFRPVFPENGYANLRTTIYDVEKVSLDNWCANNSLATPRSAGSYVHFLIRLPGVKPLVDFTYITDPVTGTYIDALKEELDKAGLNYR